jgi:hypothetical protein
MAIPSFLHLALKSLECEAAKESKAPASLLDDELIRSAGKTPLASWPFKNTVIFLCDVDKARTLDEFFERPDPRTDRHFSRVLHRFQLSKTIKQA